MPIAVTGVIAMDHLITFPGRFPARPVTGRPHLATLTFLAERLETRRGGGAANIAYGLGRLGHDPVLVGVAGSDFADYQVWLKQHGVDTDSVRVVPGEPTARQVCTTDIDGHRVSTFRPGATRSARARPLRTVLERTGGIDLVMIAPGDPAVMLRHTKECRALGLPFAVHIARQISGMSRTGVKSLVSGARCLFTGETESELLRDATGWTAGQLLDRVGAWVTALGPAGVRIERAGRRPSPVPAIGSVTVTDPAGAGDALRAGLLAGLVRGTPLERAAQLGCALASFALESPGAQEYPMNVRVLLNRVRGAYGHTAAASVRRLLTYAA
ncbi:PfkB family carbohydrate kinase [Streptomyces sp. MZ04]|uniref:PfkB family carbohydrate kinase n=1 Tax=Streptomyces sp. MZ04 TaxID=2559236 RepID=UPI00107EE212|nr:PfkB family carbohydrate kinase [Streptomyces sp. MZ04]TGB10189.1 carbohydrate kinase family protein [Streptomyces sp. MZ04]